MARFGPDTATCEVFTFREGVLAAVGHDLKLRPERFHRLARRNSALDTRSSTLDIFPR